MSDLVAWVRAQLDATEAHAKKDLWAADQATTGEWVALYGHNMPSAIETDGVRIADVASDADALLMARFKPETVRRRAEETLADVKAKRAILDEHPRVPAYDNSRYGHPAPKICVTCDHHEITGEWTLWPCKTVRLLAEGFRGRPGYEEAMDG